MPSSSRKLSKLLNLMAALTETNLPLTAQQIRERVDADFGASDEAFRQGFERAKAELRALGIEIAVEEIPNTDPPQVGYRVPRGQYALRDPGLDPDETAALHLAASLVRLDGIEGSTAVWKLGGAPGADAPEGLAALPRHPQLGPLFTAVVQRRTARFGYHGRPRQVDPYRLEFTRGHWYLHGLDHGRGEALNFRVDRVEGVPALGPPGGFERPEGADPGSLDPWRLGEGDRPPVTARVLVDAEQAAVARTTLGDAAVVDEGDDGSVVVTLDVTHVDGFRSFVLGFLDHAEVLDPPELRADIVAWLEGWTDDGPHDRR